MAAEGMHAPEVMDGFWLPQRLREELGQPLNGYASLSFASGRPSQPGHAGAISASWPLWGPGQWKTLLGRLNENRRSAPQGDEFWRRLQAALQVVGERLAEPTDPTRQMALQFIPGYTGYSTEMIQFTLEALQLMSLEQLPAALSLQPTHRATRAWQSMPGLPGRLRFFPAPGWRSRLGTFSIRDDYPIFAPPDYPALAVGYGAGNVPGTAMLIALLSLSTTLAGEPPPVVIVKNSRLEPIFAPLMLGALEQVDPDLLSTLAVLVWDYEDAAVQEVLLGEAEVVIAAASDETITQIRAQVERAYNLRARQFLANKSKGTPSPPLRPMRFHAHGHKVSFSVIGREVLQKNLLEAGSGMLLVDIVSLLAALDSVFWDQNGCLSSRVHFVEESGRAGYSAVEYAERLAAQMRMLAAALPRGAWPRQLLHDRFDRYKQLEKTSQVQVLSGYEDEFLVAVDRRTLGEAGVRAQVNDCQGRVIVVRPVADLMEVPEGYLRWLAPANLQSLSVAVGQPGTGLSESFLRFAEACGKRGVTAIRTAGRGAFPQLAYSWDGLIPLDLLHPRVGGHFTTLEFDDPYEQILETYRAVLAKLNPAG
ncbi:MAG: hypothetical protein JXB15_06505 [Anaerolineales bacterium]|nr:hypothetical protein [Anaerolineales bacterium]